MIRGLEPYVINEASGEDQVLDSSTGSGSASHGQREGGGGVGGVGGEGQQGPVPQIMVKLLLSIDRREGLEAALQTVGRSELWIPLESVCGPILLGSLQSGESGCGIPFIGMGRGN